MDRKNLCLFVVGGLIVALGLAFFVSPLASSSPDGLNKVAIDKGFSDTQKDHALADGPLAGYGVKGVDDERSDAPVWPASSASPSRSASR